MFSISVCFGGCQALEKSVQRCFDWLTLQRLKLWVSLIFLAYSVMSNHLHLVLRNRPDRVAQWGDREVAERWCRLFPGKAALERGELYDANKLKALLKDAAMLEVVRQRLSDLSWFSCVA